MDWFITLHPVLQALLATLFTWGVTALGASLVFLVKEMNKNLLTAMLGFAAGVMIAASFWSLLAPAIELAEATGVPGWIPAVVGFLSGGLFLFITDKLLPHLHPSLNDSNGKEEGIKTDLRRSVLLVLAITLHNIPEGLAVGVAFGAAAAGFPASTVVSAIALAVGIGLQNFPEGASVSLPLRKEGFSRFKAFAYGQASGIVEPFAGVIGAALVLSMRTLLPYALSFAAGA
jgi:ZIP family zinc transporter